MLGTDVGENFLFTSLMKFTSYPSSFYLSYTHKDTLEIIFQI